MLLQFIAIILGLVLLVWSADKFVEGAAVTAQHFGLPPLLIGMLIVGFGTSAPEMLVSAISAYQDNPGLALGNAYGSNITNIALILGVTALINPIMVYSQVLRKELPVLFIISLLAVYQIWDLELTRMDALVLLGVFLGLMGWSLWQGLKQRQGDRQGEQQDAFATEMTEELKAHKMPLSRAITWLVIGLLLLILSSRILVWGAVAIAQQLGVSDLIIGLTILAVGTSLPELASSVVAARKNEHDIALGNILGSNLFNTLAVVGIAGLIKPMQVEVNVLYRDMSAMLGLTFILFVFGYGFKGQGRINRVEGAVLLLSYVGYTIYLLR